MKEKLKHIFEKVRVVFGKLSTFQKFVISALILGVLILFAVVGKTASKPVMEPLYGVSYHISDKDMDKIVHDLDVMGVHYTKTDDQIFVKDSNTAMKIRTQLGIDGLIPSGVKGWELFDNQPFTTTDFERQINVRRAITDNIKKHLEMVDGIENADVVISFGEEKYFADDKSEFPLTASIVLTLSQASDIATNKNKIRGLRDLIARGVDQLNPDNVVIMDHEGNILTKQLEVSEGDAAVELAKEHLQIKEQERMKIYQELKRQLEAVFTADRFDVKVNLELNWDIEKSKEHLILPTVIKARNPDSPYDDSVVRDSLTVSQKETKEMFKGQGYIPEGPAGIEDQVPPGLKEKMDRYNTYEKNETISNQEFSRADKDITRQPYTISKINVSVFLDGIWKKELDGSGNFVFDKGSIKRDFTPVSPEILKSVDTSVRSFIGYDANRGDTVSVNSVQFDRSKQFEDEDYTLMLARHKQQTIIYGTLALLGLILLIIVYRAIKKELERRARIREEELLREQEALRLSNLQGDGLNFNIQDMAIHEMQKQITDYAKEKPEDVAKLLRAWLNSDE